MADAIVGLVRRNTYVDSITLLQLTSSIRDIRGVADASAVMATDLNRGLLRESSLLTDDAREAGSNDLVIAIRATDDAAARAALAHAEALLAKGASMSSSTGTPAAPRSLRAAHRAQPEAHIAVISVPGPYAAAEARQALADGLNVFLFSDNVALEDEVRLKHEAHAKGLLVMGPDCGTAILNGIGFGFANVVRRGSIGIIGASGTGIQEVACLLDRAGHGISHAIGTGSRDLHAAVGGITTLDAIALLRDHESTESIVLVSKPSDPEVARSVLSALAHTGKRAVAYLQGLEISPPTGVELAHTLEETARLATRETNRLTEPLTPDVGPHQRGIRGLFCGGTLCVEAADVIGDAPTHRFVDFGDDQYTRGRAHPMLDPTLRNHAIVASARDSAVAVVLLDFVLGLGAHADPAGAALSALAEATETAAHNRHALKFVAHVVGTDRDPQNLAAQEGKLRAAGVEVLGSNVSAALAARRLASGAAV